MPTRGLLFTDYDTQWTRILAEPQSARESV